MKKKMGMLLAIMILLITAACSSGEATVKADDVISKFKAAGLESENVKDLTSKDMGMGPMKYEEAKRIFVPALGEDEGGRLFVFKKESDLEELKNYYDELGKASAMFFSYTHAKGNVLLQMTSKMEKEEFAKYQKVIDDL